MKNKMEILELKNTITKNNKKTKEYLHKWGHNRMKRTEEENSELGDRTIEITQNQKQRENRLGKKRSEPLKAVGL